MISLKSKFVCTIGLPYFSSKINVSAVSTMAKAKKFIYASRFVGEPKLTDFRLEEEELPALKPNGI